MINIKKCVKILNIYNLENKKENDKSTFRIDFYNFIQSLKERYGAQCYTPSLLCKIKDQCLSFLENYPYYSINKKYLKVLKNIDFVSYDEVIDYDSICSKIKGFIKIDIDIKGLEK